MAAPRIELRAVGRRWGSRSALADVTLDIAPRSRVAIIGPSGSGKTTLLRLVMGALRSSSGAVAIDRAPIERMSRRQLRAHRRRCALIDQGSSIISQLRVHDNVIAGRLSTWPWYRTVASLVWTFEHSLVADILASVQLAERQWDRAHQLSGGQKQRVVIARALASRPDILLADEPTAALDRQTAADVLATLARSASNRQASLVVSTHRVGEVLPHVDRVLGLRDGSVYFDLRTSEVSEACLDELYMGSVERHAL